MWYVKISISLLFLKMNQIIRLDLERGFTIDSGIWISRKTLTVRLSQFLLRSSLGLRMLPKNYFLPLTRQWPLGCVKGSLYLESLRDLWENCTAMVLHWQVAVWQRCTMNIIFFSLVLSAGKRVKIFLYP